MSTENDLMPLVLLHGTADYNVPIIARHGLAASDNPALTVLPESAIYYTYDHYKGSVGLYCTVWYPKEDDVKKPSPDSTFYSIQLPLEETTKLKIEQEIEDSLRGKKSAEYIASELGRLKYAKQLLPPDRLGGYFRLTQLSRGYSEDEQVVHLLLSAEEDPGLVSINQLSDELLKCQLVCLHGKTADQIANDILTTLFFRAKPS